MWPAELLVEFALILWLAFHRDGRPKLESLIVADFIAQSGQFSAERFHLLGLAARIWYIGILIQIPMTALALSEAENRPQFYQRQILFWWVAANVGCAWIRIFPFTGTAILVLNATAFSLWLIDAVRRA